MSTFKRSRKAALIMMVPASSLLLASCSEPVTEAAVFDNSEQCAAFYDKTACEAEQTKAQELHAQTAPKYADAKQCEADFGAGNCQQAQGHSSGFFMPMMMGFLAGQLMSKNNAASQYVPTQPLYKSQDDKGTYRTASNQPVAKQTGPVTVRPAQMQVSPGQQVTRGGFGAQAQQRAAMAARQQPKSSSFGG